MTTREDMPPLRLSQIEEIQRILIEGDLSDVSMAKEYGRDPRARLITLLFWSALALLFASALLVFYQLYSLAMACVGASAVVALVFVYKIVSEISPWFRSPGEYLHGIINNGFAHDFRLVSWICRRLTQRECEALSQRLQWEQSSLSHRSQFIGSYLGRFDSLLILAFPIYFLGIPANSFLDPAMKPFIPAGIAIGIIALKVKFTHATAMSMLSWAIGITELSSKQHSLFKNETPGVEHNV